MINSLRTTWIFQISVLGVIGGIIVRVPMGGTVRPADAYCCLAQDLLMGVVQGMVIVAGSPSFFCGMGRVTLSGE